MVSFSWGGGQGWGLREGGGVVVVRVVYGIDSSSGRLQLA